MAKMIHSKCQQKVHKPKDFVPLSSEEDFSQSDEDESDDQPVFDLKGTAGEGYDDEDSYESDDDPQLRKFERQQKYIRAKVGGVEDDTLDDDHANDDSKQIWGSRKHIYYDGDNADFEIQSSDEELLAEEEAEVLRLQKERAKYLSLEDFGLEDICENDKLVSIGVREASLRGKSSSNSLQGNNIEGDQKMVYETVKKDLNALSREELMEYVHSSAPELVALLPELDDAYDQLVGNVTLLSSKLEERERWNSRMNYFQLKNLLLLLYCEAINAYLQLKIQGHLLYDHPVFARIAHIKNELVQVDKLVEDHLHIGIDAILHGNERVHEDMSRGEDGENSTPLCSSSPRSYAEHASPRLPQGAMTHPENHEDDIEKRKEGSKKKGGDGKLSKQSMEMLKMKAALDEKVRERFGIKSVSNSDGTGIHKPTRSVAREANGRFETPDDFADEPVRAPAHTHNVWQLVNHAKKFDQKISYGGDDDLPSRGDIGERRREHELRILARAGVGSENAAIDEEAEDEFQRQREKKRGNEVTIDTGMPAVSETVDGKRRRITSEMEKNRGLTRYRKKEIKNPRKKYKLKHKKAVIRRKGQVRELRTPCGPYGGESTGINPEVSRSIRFK